MIKRLLLGPQSLLVGVLRWVALKALLREVVTRVSVSVRTSARILNRTIFIFALFSYLTTIEALMVDHSAINALVICLSNS